jgi:hypothetical protein
MLLVYLIMYVMLMQALVNFFALPCWTIYNVVTFF